MARPTLSAPLAALLGLSACASGSPAPPPPSPARFDGSVILGAPTSSSVRVTLLSPLRGGAVTLRYGTEAAALDRETSRETVVPGEPLAVNLDGLAPDTRHFYRVRFQAPGAAPADDLETSTFHTARPPGSAFRFTVQADSHLDENSSLDVYHRTLENVLADLPDFHVDLGDTFMCEKHVLPLDAASPPAVDAAGVEARYASERAHFGPAARSAPLFLVNGNHEGEAGWLATGSAQSLPVWATLARKRHFPVPDPGAFYSGDTADEPFVGRRGAWYAFTWGDALVVVIDPFWSSRQQPGRDAWNLTLGAAQHAWLERTLAASTATFKLVFVHNLVGGLDGQMRGGAEAAPYYEWGGRNADGTDGFAARRPGWSAPIHALLVAHRVTAVFHGHDHLYAHQELDGIVYQAVPQPSALNSQSGPQLAAAYHYASGTVLSSSGHLRITVSPGQLTAEYVRSWTPPAESASRRNGEIAHAWSVAAPAPARSTP